MTGSNTVTVAPATVSDSFLMCSSATLRVSAVQALLTCTVAAVTSGMLRPRCTQGGGMYIYPRVGGWYHGRVVGYPSFLAWEERCMRLIVASQPWRNRRCMRLIVASQPWEEKEVYAPHCSLSTMGEGR